MKFILGTKIGMSQIFDEKGQVVPVTLIEAGPCVVTQVKTDGYNAIQIGFIKLKEKKIKKSQKQKPFRYLREFKEDSFFSTSAKALEFKEDSFAARVYKVGDQVDVSVFQEGERVKVSGTSKGKGFQGAVKRWGFSGRGASHGVKHEARTLGSVGTSFPERVIKGRKMPGRMGSERTTVKNLEIVKIDKENNLLAIKGAIP